MLLSNSQIKSIKRDYRKALKYPALNLFLLALNLETEVGISGGTKCLSILGFICIFSDSQENKIYLHKVIKTNENKTKQKNKKRKLALNSWLVKSSQLNLLSFNEDLV